MMANSSTGPKVDRIGREMEGLSNTELVDLFYRVFSSKKQVDRYRGEVDDAHCVAIVGFSDQDGVAEIELWGYPKEGIGAFSNRAKAIGPVESGRCPRCQVVVTSLSKTAICPVCDSEVECT